MCECESWLPQPARHQTDAPAPARGVGSREPGGENARMEAGGTDIAPSGASPLVVGHIHV